MRVAGRRTLSSGIARGVAGRSCRVGSGIYVTPACAPWPSGGKARAASYRWPLGRFAAVPVGIDVEFAHTNRHEKLRARRARAPAGQRELSGSDARNTILDRLPGRPITIATAEAPARLLPVLDAFGSACNKLMSRLGVAPLRGAGGRTE